MLPLLFIKTEEKKTDDGSEKPTEDQGITADTSSGTDEDIKTTDRGNRSSDISNRTKESCSRTDKGLS